MNYPGSKQEERFMEYFERLPNGKGLSPLYISKKLKISNYAIYRYINGLVRQNKILRIRFKKTRALYVKI